MALILFDDSSRSRLLPLTFTRPVAACRIGILTIAEKWEKYLGIHAFYQTEAYLQEKFAVKYDDENLLINGSICPNTDLIESIQTLSKNNALYHGSTLLALYLPKSLTETFNYINPIPYRPIQYTGLLTQIIFPEDIFKFNDAEIRQDYHLLTKGRISQKLSPTNHIIGDDIFVEEGATATCATFNSLQGPIYLGKNSQVWEGAHIRGSFALCDHAQVKMGAKIYGMSTIGPHTKVGGEINNAVIFGYSSKGHDGYLGNSVLGEWCNIGAGSNTSNLKNNYAEVSLWDYPSSSARKTGLQFCGLIMADHAKCSINTMFNTGTTVGVGANIFGSGFHKNFIPDFSWAAPSAGFKTYILDKMLQTAEKAFERRDIHFDEIEKQILKAVFDCTKKNK